MIEVSLATIADMVGGRVDGGTGEELVTGAVEFDSRKTGPGDLFLAIPGAVVDGHDFAGTAVAAGAVGVIAARPVGVPAVIVPPATLAGAEASYALEHDTTGEAASIVAALGRLARAVTDRLDVLVVGVTGSAGKTSTKDFMASVFGACGPTVAPPGSFNNEIGHPYTALRCTPETKFLVTELSARGVGHVRHLTELVPPSIGVVLNVGTAHLGEFGSREVIAQAKGELVEALPADGVAVLNADDPLVAAMRSRTQARVLEFSAQHPADVWADALCFDELQRARFDLVVGDQRAPVTLKVVGAHQVSNALAAAAAAVAAGVDLPRIAAALSAHDSASAHRMALHVREDGLKIVDDAYNANPESMVAGLNAAAKMTQGARIAVLGPMAEIADSDEENLRQHRQIIDAALDLGFGPIIIVGQRAECAAMVQAAGNLGVLAQSLEHARDLVEEAAGSGDVVFVKASNSFALWKVAEALMISGADALHGKEHKDLS